MLRGGTRLGAEELAHGVEVGLWGVFASIRPKSKVEGRGRATDLQELVELRDGLGGEQEGEDEGRGQRVEQRAVVRQPGHEGRALEVHHEHAHLQGHRKGQWA